MKKRIWLERRVEKNKEARLKAKLTLKKTAAYLSTFHRKSRTNLLSSYGSLFEKAGLVDADADEDVSKIYFDEEVVYGFLCAIKNTFLRKKCEFYRLIGKELGGGTAVDGYRKSGTKNCGVSKTQGDY